MAMRVLTAFAGLLALILAANSYPEETLNQLENEGIERTAEGQAVEERLGTINDRNRELRDAYESQLKLVQGLETYLELLNQQIDGQNEEVDLLRRSITDVAVLERQVLPLMLKMINSLEAFTALDVPFLRAERSERIDKLRSLLGRSDVTVAEKCRRVFEAFQIENEYGRTIESYTAKLDLEGASYDAAFLRIGRLGLLYKTVGSNQVGYWDNQTASWQPLERTPWVRLINQGLKVARQEIAPELVHVAVNPSKVGAQ